MNDKTPRPTDNAAKQQFGYENLGPVIADYLLRLHAQILTFEEEHDAKVLFASRAGVRIRRALDVLIATAGLPEPKNADFFWISRLMVAKGVWSRNPAGTIATFSKEFAHTRMANVVRAMFRFSPQRAKVRPTGAELEAPGSAFKEFITGGGEVGEFLRAFLHQQSLLFERYVRQLMGQHRVALLVDTGWQGTAQALLADSFQEYKWWGSYFGRFGFPESNRAHWPNMLGVVFEADAYDPRRPETSVVLNRHLFESLFEPFGHSIEWMAQDDKGRVVAPDAKGILEDAPRPETDPLYCGVLAYLKELPHGRSLAQMRNAASEAWLRIARVIVHPTKDELKLVQGMKRSADFGRDLEVPILWPAKPRFEGDTSEQRIRDSLWPCGQAAVEYPPDGARALQKRLAGIPTSELPATRRIVVKDTPAVAVITRTMDRPMFLERALLSVASQTFRDYIHVVVNDGGDNDAVKDTITQTHCDHARVRLVDAVKNRGMEAASNLAIRNSQSDFIVIHDDDDSWEPEFLTKTVAFLESRDGKRYGGVITRSTYCSEEVTADGIVVHARSPYKGWVENVHLMEMAIGNFFPPIAFLFRRDVWEKLGGFNELYPVLGDWDFNLRFLVDADIGVIREPLANYHHRDRGDATVFGNSVIAARDKHLEFSAIVRNNLLRSLAKRGHSAAASLIGMGLYLEDQRNIARANEARLAQLGEESSSQRARLNALGSSLWADRYWVAFLKLLRGVSDNDTTLLSRISALAAQHAKSPVLRLLSRTKGGALNRQEVANREGIEHAAAELLKDIITAPAAHSVDLLIPPDFDEAAYLRQNPDVEVCVKRGDFGSGYEHYLKYGRDEGRARPSR